jgi:hypothetical protein
LILHPSFRPAILTIQDITALAGSTNVVGERMTNGACLRFNIQNTPAGEKLVDDFKRFFDVAGPKQYEMTGGTARIMALTMQYCPAK